MAVSNDRRAAEALERNVPLSQSLIWRRQRDFYVQRGLKAWSEDQVPAYITNNPFFAEICAAIVFGFLKDCMASSDGDRMPPTPENPLRILELGAGTGKFSYLFLRRLIALMRDAGIAAQTVRYCMTDCAESVVQAWRSNPYLSEFVDAGVLEFEVLRAGEESASPFLGSNPALSATAAGPLVVIANYVFDSLPQDAFAVQDGKLFEALITTASPDDRAGAAPGSKLSDLKLTFENVAVTGDRYSDPAWNAILEHYRTNLSAATILFPARALTTLRELARHSDGRMLVLVADKGQTNEGQLALAQGPPVIEFHSAECFSLMVNFHAIARVIASKGRESQGGRALLPDKQFSGLNICAFLQGGHDDHFAATTAAYGRSQDAIGPDDLFTLLAWLNAHMEEMSVAQILSALRLARWDTIAWMRLFPVLARQVRNVIHERSDLRTAVLRTWANHFPVAPDDNALAFQCGAILLELKYFDEAAEMLRTSQRILGPSAATSYNLGLCAQGAGHMQEALQFMVEACALDPNFEPARASRLKLENEVK